MNEYNLQKVGFQIFVKIFELSNLEICFGHMHALYQIAFDKLDLCQEKIEDTLRGTNLLMDQLYVSEGGAPSYATCPYVTKVSFRFSSERKARKDWELSAWFRNQNIDVYTAEE